MFLTTRHNTSLWVDSHEARGKRFVSYESSDAIPVLARVLIYTCAFFSLFMIASMLFIAVDDWSTSSQVFLGTSEFAFSLICGWGLAKSRRPESEARLREIGVLSSQHSYPFRRLNEKLAELRIYISEINDKIDHEICTQHIVAYLKATQKHADLLARDNITDEQRTELETFVKELAQDYALLIKSGFDRRGAKKRGEIQETLRLEAAIKERQTMIDRAYAELLIEAQRHGLVG